jgi:hypothetical protein
MDPLGALATRLEQEGFTADERPPDRASFGDQVITFAAADLRVLLTRDRGQWSLELGHPDWGEAYDADIWRAALEGTDPTEPTTLEAQAAYVSDRLAALRVAAGDPSLRDRLDEIAIARADLWFG